MPSDTLHAPAAPASRPLRRLRHLALLSAAGVLVACAAGPDDAYEGFTNALAEGKIEEAKQYMPPTMSAIPDSKLTPALAEVTREMQGRGGLDRVRIVSVEENGDLATVIAEQHFGNGAVQTDTMPMLKDAEGKWRLNPPMNTAGGK